MQRVLGRGEAYTEFCWGDMRERDNLEDPGVDGRIILRWILQEVELVMDWIDPAQERDMWRTLVNAVIDYKI